MWDGRGSPRSTRNRPSWASRHRSGPGRSCSSASRARASTPSQRDPDPVAGSFQDRALQLPDGQRVVHHEDAGVGPGGAFGCGRQRGRRAPPPVSSDGPVPPVRRGRAPRRWSRRGRCWLPRPCPRRGTSRLSPFTTTSCWPMSPSTSKAWRWPGPARMTMGPLAASDAGSSQQVGEVGHGDRLPVDPDRRPALGMGRRSGAGGLCEDHAVQRRARTADRLPRRSGTAGWPG